MNIYKILALSFLVLFLSRCSNKKNEKENTYAIINKIINEKVNSEKIINFERPVQPDSLLNSSYALTLKDSLNLYKKFYEETSRKKLIGIKPTVLITKDDISYSNNCEIDIDIESFLHTQVKTIDLNKIELYGNNSIVYYTDYYKNKNSKGFDEIGIVFHFSKIKFNRKYTKAILILGASFGKLDGVSTYYYLEKKGLK